MDGIILISTQLLFPLSTLLSSLSISLPSPTTELLSSIIMYTQNHIAFSGPAATQLLPFSVISEQLAADQLESATMRGFDLCYSSSYGLPTSFGAIQRPGFIPRSSSSLSLQKSAVQRPLSSGQELADSVDAPPVRRAYSAGDLQRMNKMQRNLSYKSESPLSSESSMVIESMNKACRYSPEEKKERIERYKSKRSKRNFNKKIKYACRKTLADSRPRIKGRFARNDEFEKGSEVNWNQTSGEEEEEDEDSWINFIDTFMKSMIQ